MVLIVGNDVEINILDFEDRKILYGISPHTIYLIGENSLKGKYIPSLDESFDVYDNIDSKKNLNEVNDNNILPSHDVINYIKKLYPRKILDTNEIHRILFIDLYSNQINKENRFVILPKRCRYDKRVDIKCY